MDLRSSSGPMQSSQIMPPPAVRLDWAVISVGVANLLNRQQSQHEQSVSQGSTVKFSTLNKVDEYSK